MTHDKQLIERLKPCPFPHEVKRGPFIERDTTDFWIVRVACGDCGCAGPYVPFDVEPVQADEDEAIRLWNTRTDAQRISTLTAEVEARDKLIGVMADALDVADGIIAVNCGTGTPREWDCAFRSVQKARATLTKGEGTEI